MKGLVLTVKNFILLSVLCIFILLSGLMFIFAAPVRAYTSGVALGVLEIVAPECDELTVTGTQPFITLTPSPSSALSISDEEYKEFQNKINTSIDGMVTKKIEDGIDNRARSIALSYRHETTEDYVSIVLYFTLTFSGHIKQEVKSVNFDIKNLEFITVNSIMGPNGIKLLNAYLSNLIRADYSKYNLNFQGITEDSAFYSDAESVYLLFNSYELTKGNPEIETVGIKRSLVKNYSLNANVNRTRDNYYSVLLPLREVCEYFGYEILWHGAGAPIVIRRGEFQTGITPDLNEYKKGSLDTKLEAPPMLIDGLAHVPVTFFEEILPLVYYVDGSDVIISEITLP